MSYRRSLYALLAIAVICAVSLLFVMMQINDARIQLQQKRPGAFNYIIQTSRVLHRLTE